MTDNAQSERDPEQKTEEPQDLAALAQKRRTLEITNPATGWGELTVRLWKVWLALAFITIWWALLLQHEESSIIADIIVGGLPFVFVFGEAFNRVRAELNAMRSTA